MQFVSRVFANGPGDLSSIPGRVIPKTLKMVLDATLLGKVALSTIRWRSRVKWSNPGDGVAPSPTPQCCSYWKGRLQVTLDEGHPRLKWPTLLYFTYIYICVCECVCVCVCVCVCMFVWIFWYINLCRLFIVKSIFILINNSISNNSIWHKYTVYIKSIFCLKLFSSDYRSKLTIQFSISIVFV